jgi:hypothetical protein
VISVIAVATAEKGVIMNAIPEETANVATTAPAEAPVSDKKPHVRAHGPHVAKSRARSGQKATPATKRHTARVSAKSAKKAAGARQGSKTAKVLDLLRRSGGASGKELMKATGWQAHSLRGFMSGVLGKKMGFTVSSTKTADGERRYAIKR